MAPAKKTITKKTGAKKAAAKKAAPKATTTTTTATSTSPFAKLGLGNVTLPSYDDVKASLPVDPERLMTIVRDAAYVVIGVGVLTVRQLQAGARALIANVEANPVVQQMGIDRGQIEEVVAKLEAQVATISDRFDALENQLDDAFEKLEGRLPQQAADALGQAHDLAKAARKQVRGLLRTA